MIYLLIKNILPMKTILNILTLGIYSLLCKKKTLDQTVKKKTYRDDGTLKKEIERSTTYSEDQGSTELPK